MSKGFSVMAEALRKAGYVVEKKGGDTVVVQEKRTVIVEVTERELPKAEDILLNVEATHGKVGARAIARNVAAANAKKRSGR